MKEKIRKYGSMLAAAVFVLSASYNISNGGGLDTLFDVTVHDYRCKIVETICTDKSQCPQNEKCESRIPDNEPNGLAKCKCWPKRNGQKMMDAVTSSYN